MTACKLLKFKFGQMPVQTPFPGSRRITRDYLVVTVGNNDLVETEQASDSLDQNNKVMVNAKKIRQQRIAQRFMDSVEGVSSARALHVTHYGSYLQKSCDHIMWNQERATWFAELQIDELRLLVARMRQLLPWSFSFSTQVGV